MLIRFILFTFTRYYHCQKDFKVYVFEWDVYVKAEDYKEIAIKNKKLRAYVDNLDSENDNQAIEIEELKKENKKLKKYYDRDKEELMESCYSLAKENDKLKSDLEECECSLWFENDEVWFWKREYKRLKKWIKDHCKWYWNLFPEDEMKRQWKKADKTRKIKSTYVYDAKQVRDIC